MLQDCASLAPRPTSQPEKRVERISREQMSILPKSEMPFLLQRRKIDNVLANGDSYSRRTCARSKNSKG